jgi:hypothetical protein
VALVVWLCFGLCLAVGLCFLVCLVVGGGVLFVCVHGVCYFVVVVGVGACWVHFGLLVNGLGC